MRDVIEFLAMIGCAVALIVVTVVGSAVGYNLGVDKPACEAYGKLSGQQTFYSLGTSCIVKRDGEWVNYEVAVGKKQEITLKGK